MAGLSPTLTRLAKKLGRQALREVLKQADTRRAQKSRASTATSPSKSTSGRTIPKPPTSGGRSATASGGTSRKVDARKAVTPTPDARLHVEYAPSRDGDADPGEIVWTWVPYEEDASKGKDRPVLVVGRWGEDVAALALTSKAHDDRHHHPVGVWDANDGRDSWLKLDRILRLDPDGIRREGAVLGLEQFRSAIRAWEAYQ